MKSFEISKIINEVYEGVERSIVGEIFVKDDNGQKKMGPEGFPLINHLPLNTFLTTLSALLPKNVSGDFDVSGEFNPETNKTEINFKDK